MPARPGALALALSLLAAASVLATAKPSGGGRAYAPGEPLTLYATKTGPFKNPRYELCACCACLRERLACRARVRAAGRAHSLPRSHSFSCAPVSLTAVPRHGPSPAFTHSETYSYYKLPFCPPANPKHTADGLGAVSLFSCSSALGRIFPHLGPWGGAKSDPHALGRPGLGSQRACPAGLGWGVALRKAHSNQGGARAETSLDPARPHSKNSPLSIL